MRKRETLEPEVSGSNPTHNKILNNSNLVSSSLVLVSSAVFVFSRLCLCTAAWPLFKN